MSQKINVSLEELERLYREGKSSLVLAEELGASKKWVLGKLSSLPNWKELKRLSLSLAYQKKLQSKSYTGICEYCKSEFTSTKKQRYCGKSCVKTKWQRAHRIDNRDSINEKRRRKRELVEKKLSLKGEWEQKFIEKLKQIHKRKVEIKVARVLKRVDSVKNGMVTRSKKYNVICDITVEELRQLAYDAYGTPCKYSDRLLTIDNMVFDHLVPISKGGASTKDNIQVISKFSNSMKGSLDEASFLILLEWLKTVPEDLAKDISIRLAKGIH